MPILVQKFGGTSVASASARQSAVKKVLAARQSGYDVAVVVSAAELDTVAPGYAKTTVLLR